MFVGQNCLKNAKICPNFALKNAIADKDVTHDGCGTWCHALKKLHIRHELGQILAPLRMLRFQDRDCTLC